MIFRLIIDNYTNEIYKSCGEEFNINSPKQMQEILFNKLGLKSGRKTKTGFSTDARSLRYLRGEHEIIRTVLDYRQVTKLKSTYADSLPNLDKSIKPEEYIQALIKQLHQPADFPAMIRIFKIFL